VAPNHGWRHSFKTVDPDGTYRLGYTSYAGDYTIRGDYNGTLSVAGGTLSGTRVLTRETARHVETRNCTVFRVELLKQ